MVANWKLASAGSGSLRASWKLALETPASLRLLLGPFEGVARDLVAVELRGGEGARHLDQGHTGAAAHVRHARAGLEPRHQALDARQRHGDQERAEPGREAALDAGGAAGAQGVVVEAHAAREGRGQLLEHGDGVGQRREHAAAEGGVGLVGQHGAGLGRQAEALLVVGLEHAGGALLVQPLAQPALRQARAAGQLL